MQVAWIASRQKADRRERVEYLVDTNVLVYALDAGDPTRRKRARDWLTFLVEQENGALSTQALTELANVCLSRLNPPWEPSVVNAHLRDLSLTFDVLPVTTSVVSEALRGVQDHQMSFLDAQMWAVAKLYQLPYLLTEDMATGATIEGVMIIDPFSLAPPA